MTPFIWSSYELFFFQSVYGELLHFPSYSLFNLLSSKSSVRAQFPLVLHTAFRYINIGANWYFAERTLICASFNPYRHFNLMCPSLKQKIIIIYFLLSKDICMLLFCRNKYIYVYYKYSFYSIWSLYLTITKYFPLDFHIILYESV